MRFKATLAAITSALIMALAWELGRWLAGGKNFPGFLEVLARASHELTSWNLVYELGTTLGLSFLGLIIGLILSYTVGLVVSQNDFLDESTRHTLNYLRSIPSVILIPLFLVVLGPSASAVLALVSFVLFSKLIVFVVDGMKATDKTLNSLGELHGWNSIQRFLLIKIPASAMFVLSGLQVSVSRAYGTVILCGLLIGAPGLGKLIGEANNNADFEGLYAYGLIVAAIGVVLFGLVAKLETFLKESWGLVA